MVKRRYYLGSEKYGYSPGGENVDISQVVKCESYANGEIMDISQVVKIRIASRQGCISCGILVSGIRARGVSSEHMENMEMFSCSPT